MSLFNAIPADALYFSMDDPDELMARNSTYPFNLDGREWPTVEHYYQCMKFDNKPYQQKIATAATAQEAKKLGTARFKRKRADLATVKTTLMTRAVYTQAKTYPVIADHILATGDRQLIENSQFDYYWGCGRDHRGDNRYGRVIMNVRDKLANERASRGAGD